MIYLCIFLYVIGIPLFKNWVDHVCYIVDEDLDPSAVAVCNFLWPILVTLMILDRILDFIYICNKGEK